MRAPRLAVRYPILAGGGGAGVQAVDVETASAGRGKGRRVTEGTEAVESRAGRQLPLLDRPAMKAIEAADAGYGNGERASLPGGARRDRGASHPSIDRRAWALQCQLPPPAGACSPAFVVLLFVSGQHCVVQAPGRRPGDHRFSIAEFATVVLRGASPAASFAGIRGRKALVTMSMTPQRPTMESSSMNPRRLACRRRCGSPSPRADRAVGGYGGSSGRPNGGWTAPRPSSRSTGWQRPRRSNGKALYYRTRKSAG